MVEVDGDEILLLVVLRSVEVELILRRTKPYNRDSAEHSNADTPALSA